MDIRPSQPPVPDPAAYLSHRGPLNTVVVLGLLEGQRAHHVLLRDVPTLGAEQIVLKNDGSLILLAPIHVKHLPLHRAFFKLLSESLTQSEIRFPA